MKYLGNKKILELYKTGFLSSQRCPAEVVLKSYDWAKQQRKEGNCIICGNHSQIEKDVFEILLRGKQPMILVLGRSMQKYWEPTIQKAIDEDRLLIIAPFNEDVILVTRETALVRNKFIVELADEMIAGYVSAGGQLEEIFQTTDYTTV